MTTVHVIGAGLAGLSAALILADAGRQVIIHESAPQAGGRCRSYNDPALGCMIDNGNHLLLSGNRQAAAFIARIGAGSRFVRAPAVFAFADLVTGASWTVRPNAGRLPWWLLIPGRRVPGTCASDYRVLARLLRAKPEDTVARVLDRGNLLYARLLEPLAIAALNTRPETASAPLLAAVIRQTLLRGATACAPLLPRVGLSASLIDPALAALSARGVQLRTSARVTAIAIEAGRAVALTSPDGPTPLAETDAVVSAVPAPRAAALLPGLHVPEAHETIINIHYALPGPRLPAFVGLIGGVAEWVFAKPDHASVTISAANHLADAEPETLARTAWPETRAALAVLTVPSLPALPVWRVVRERRATFVASAAEDRRRPPARTDFHNIALAGDWTATGLPATIEGAIKSGRTAAEMIIGQAGRD